MNQLIDAKIIFEKSQLRPGLHIADFGCGQTGTLVFPASIIIGERGVVYAVDILKTALEQINKRVKLENLSNVHTVWSDVERVGGTAIPEKSLDTIYIMNILSHAISSQNMLREAARLLKEKGRLTIIDWARGGLPFGPKSEKMINFEDIKKWATTNNFVVQEEFSPGNYHKGLVLFKQD
jgi:ubiquinone/menaquinone biosynthesis C-methylase UbiE